MTTQPTRGTAADTYRTWETRRDTYANRVQEFDAFDRFGRRIGARATTCVTDFFEKSAEGLISWPKETRPAGVYYSFSPHALRNGKAYGASHGFQHFATEAERDAAVARYFADAEKRARKNAGK